MTYGGGHPVVSRYEAFGARACHPIYNALDPDTHHPVRAGPAVRRGPRLPRQPHARSRGAGADLLPRAGGGGAGEELPARRLRLGALAADRQRARHRPCRLGRAQRLQRHAQGGAQRQPREHGPCRLLPAHPRVRGGGRRRLPDHRPLGGRRRILSRPARRSSSPATARTSPRSWAGSPRKAASRIGARALDRALADHTYARRAVEADAILRALKQRKPPRGEGRHDGAPPHRRAGPVAVLVLGQRPRDDLSCAAARPRDARPSGSPSSSATCPGTRAVATWPTPDFCDLRLYADLAELETHVATIRDADAVIVGSYVPGRAGGDRPGAGDRARGGRLLRHRHARDAGAARPRRDALARAAADPRSSTSTSPSPAARRSTCSSASTARGRPGRCTARWSPSATSPRASPTPTISAISAPIPRTGSRRSTRS